MAMHTTHMVQHLVCHKHGTRYFHTSETLSTGRAMKYTHNAHQEWSVFTFSAPNIFIRFLCTHLPITELKWMYAFVHIFASIFAHIFAHIFCTYICTYILHIYLHIYICTYMLHIYF